MLELTRVKLSFLSEEALKEQDEAYLASLPKPKVKPEPKAVPVEKAPKPAKLSKEEEILREKWSRLLDMVSKGRVEPLRTFWVKESSNLGGPDARIPEWIGDDAGRTLLQFAAQSGQEETTRWFLQEGRSDPTLPVHTEVDPSSKILTACDISKTKAVRDVFRRCAAEQPDLWDWFGAGHVPSALSKEMEEERDEKKKARRKGLKDKVREREAKEKDKVQSRSPSPQLPLPPHQSSAAANSTGARRLGGVAGASEGVTGLTPEMRAKVERERRARAAEARLKSLGSR